MRWIDHHQLDLHASSDMDIQATIDGRLYGELNRRAIPGNVIYIALFAWVLYATKLLESSPNITFMAGMMIMLASLLRMALHVKRCDILIPLPFKMLIFTVCTILIAIAWSALAVSALTTDWDVGFLHQDVLMMAILLFSIVGGAVNVLAIAPKLLQSFLMIMLLPLLCGLVFIATQTAWALAILLLCGLLFSMDVGRRIYADYRQQLEYEIKLGLKSELLEQSRDIALDAVRSKSAFLANMSHEIRTPMNGVLGMSNLLLGTALNQQQHDFVQGIKRSGDALLLIINDILDFSKIEAGKLELEQHAFSCRTVVEDVAEMLFEQASKKGIEIVIDLPVALPNQLLGDGGRLRQIFANLLSNAVKFTTSGEVVTAIEVLNDHADIVRLRCSVKDTGIGLDVEKQHHIFDCFTQADTSTTREYGGTGLGLAICKQLVTAMEGEIAVHSKEGKGSAFVFEIDLPVVERDLSLLHDTFKGLRALVVESNQTCAETLATQLQDWGMRVEQLQNGDELITVLRQTQAHGVAYDVLLIDMHVLNDSGMQLAKEIRRMAEFDAIAIVLMSSSGSDTDAVMTSDIAMNGCVSKPIRQSRLYHALSHALQHEHANIALQHVQPKQEALGQFEACVLLAEDNDVNQTVAKLLLEELGCEVRLACDGKEAIEGYLNGGVDVIFMDCQMPVMDGYDACRRIRHLEQQAFGDGAENVPIIALTANAMRGDKALCIEAGMDDYLSKPFSREQLFGLLSKYVPERCKSTRATLTENPATCVEQTIEALNLAAMDADVLQALPGGVKMLEKVLKIFHTSSNSLMSEMEAGLASDDADQVMRAAHTLKSSAAMVGAKLLSKLCKDVEKITHTGEMDGVACMVQEIHKALEQVTMEIDSVYL